MNFQAAAKLQRLVGDEEKLFELSSLIRPWLCASECVDQQNHYSVFDFSSSRTARIWSHIDFMYTKPFLLVAAVFHTWKISYKKQTSTLSLWLVSFCLWPFISQDSRCTNHFRFTRLNLQRHVERGKQQLLFKSPSGWSCTCTCEKEGSTLPYVLKVCHFLRLATPAAQEARR